MSNQSNGRKTSQFIAQTSLPSDAYVPYISGNVNYRISLADFQASLGVTGTIVQQGDPLGTPILNKSGSVNGIRNVEDGPGVKSSVSALGGLKLEHNFIEDTTGVKLVTDLTATQPKFRSLVQGPGINISSSNGSIQIALSSTPVSTKTVIVNSISDFPAAVGGVITLADNTEYAIRNDISTANRFVIGDNTIISGSDSIVVSMTYTDVGTMFTATSASCKIKEITVNFTSGSFLDFNGTGTEVLQIVDCVINGATLGTIDDFYGLQLEGNQISCTTDGFLFGGSNGVLLASSQLVTAGAGTIFDLGVATFLSFSVTDCFATLNGASVFLDGAAASANIDATGLGTVHNCRFFGTGTPLQTILYDDDRWQFFINDDIQETHRDSLLSLVGNLTATVIAAAGTPVLVAGTWNLEHASKFTQTAAGRSTYDGIKPAHFDVTASFSCEPVSGTNKVIGFYVYKNGTKIANSEATAVVSAGDAKRVTVVWRLQLDPTDYIEIYVENETDTVDVLVSDAVIRIS